VARVRRLSAKLVPTFADRGCHVVSVIDPLGRNIRFLDQRLYFFLQVAPQFRSLGRLSKESVQVRGLCKLFVSGFFYGKGSDGVMWTGLVWLRIGTDGELL
jgi:hypothetical protein